MNSPPRAGDVGRGLRRAFTLVEVLAALLLMAIIIPVALGGMGSIARAADLGRRKVTAMRVADRVLEEQLLQLAQGQQVQAAATGVEAEGTDTYPWTMQTEAWSQDSMTLMTVTVRFTVRGGTYDMQASTLFDPDSGVPGTGTATSTVRTGTTP